MQAVGDGIAPPRGSTDAENVAWCLANDYALVRRSPSKKNREMTELLARHADLNLVLVDRRITLVIFSTHSSAGMRPWMPNFDAPSPARGDPCACA